MDEILDLLTGLELAYKHKDRWRMLRYIIDLKVVTQKGKFCDGAFVVMMTVLVSYVAFVGSKEPDSLDTEIISVAAKRILEQMTDERIQEYIINKLTKL